MTDAKTGDLEPVVEEQADAEQIEDQDFDGFDNLDDAVDALEDDISDDEEPEIKDEAPEEVAEAEDEESDAGDAIVELLDGNTLTLSEIADLQADGLRSADYTHKTTELARERESVDADRKTYTERMQFAETTLQNIAGFMQSLIPEEPPISLARQDSGAYMEQMALRKAAIAELQTLTQMSASVQGHKAEADGGDLSKFRETEAAALVKSMPHLSDPVKKAAFDKVISKAAEDFGFSPEEIATTSDHRILQLVHYARMGKRSEQNRNNARKRVQTPSKGKARAAQIPAKQRANSDAMRRLSKSGTIADAMEIDFD